MLCDDRDPSGRGRRAVFLDRDGVLNDLVHDPAVGTSESPLRVSDVSLMAGAPAAARALEQAGFILIGVSNQPAAAKGGVSLGQLLAVHLRVSELLTRERVDIAAWRLCLHHPRGVIPSLSRPCTCRKPAPGMLLDAARTLDVELPESWMVGDTDADIAAGRAAGCRTLLIEHEGSFHKRLRGCEPDLRAADLARGASLLMGV
ncbi:MAG TPA: HAD-IIIA family hydrolase [Solirubrobacteraceae bacterium]